MAILDLGTQHRYASRGPLDAKAAVKTFDDLINQSTWTVGSTITAYNGMLTAVWFDKQLDQSGKQVLSDKNGIYMLFDASLTSAIKAPDVTNPDNWHKLAEISDLAARLTAIDERLVALEEESDVLTYGYRSGFPTVGEANKLYVAADEGKTYIWFNNQYLLVGGSQYEEPAIIYGGSAN